MTEEKCTAKIVFGDDFGDNNCTFHCGLKKGHEGRHEEIGSLYDEQPFGVSWDNAMQKPKEECISRATASIEMIVQDLGIPERALNGEEFPSRKATRDNLISEIEDLIDSAKADTNFDSSQLPRTKVTGLGSE